MSLSAIAPAGPDQVGGYTIDPHPAVVWALKLSNESANSPFAGTHHRGQHQNSGCPPAWPAPDRRFVAKGLAARLSHRSAGSAACAHTTAAGSRTSVMVHDQPIVGCGWWHLVRWTPPEQRPSMKSTSGLSICPKWRAWADKRLRSNAAAPRRRWCRTRAKGLARSDNGEDDQRVAGQVGVDAAQVCFARTLTIRRSATLSLSLKLRLAGQRRVSYCARTDLHQGTGNVVTSAHMTRQRR